MTTDLYVYSIAAAQRAMKDGRKEDARRRLEQAVWHMREVQHPELARVERWLGALVGRPAPSGGAIPEAS
ncbi:MAG: hypothetical protein JNK46_07445 [Methylobacteriaceae bacterium]|nr:hypothetical protein [Methylobacteriaceae bacterium]